MELCRFQSVVFLMVLVGGSIGRGTIQADPPAINPSEVQPTIFAPFGRAVIQGFGGAAGVDMWNKLKEGWNQQPPPPLQYPMMSQPSNGFRPPQLPPGIPSPWQAPPALLQPIMTEWRHAATGQVFVMVERGAYVLLYTTNPNIQPALVGLGYRVGNVIHFNSIGKPNNPTAAGQARVTTDANGVWWFDGRFQFPNPYGGWGPHGLSVVIYRFR